MRRAADILSREAGRRSCGTPNVRLSPLWLGIDKDSRKSMVEVCPLAGRQGAYSFFLLEIGACMRKKPADLRRTEFRCVRAKQQIPRRCAHRDDAKGRPDWRGERR